MKRTITGILLLLALQIFATEKRDSLLNLVIQAENDSIKTDLYFQLSNTTTGEDRLDYLKKVIAIDAKYDHRYFGHKPFYNIAILGLDNNKVDSVKYYLGKAMFYAKQNNDSTSIAKIYHSFSVYYRFMGDNPKTVSYTKKAREIYECLKDSFQYYRLLCNEAYCNYGMGNMEEAQKLFGEVINNATHPRDSWIIASSNLGLGTLVKNQSNYQGAIQHYLEAYKIWKELNDTTYFCRALNNIGITYKNLSMFSMAMSSYQEIIDTKPSKDPYAIPLALANMSTIYSQKNDFKNANSNIDLALQKIDSIGNIYYKMALKNIKGDILIKEAKYEEAKPYIEAGLKLAEEHNFSNDYCLALTLYANILYNTNNYSEALTHAEKALAKAQENLNTNHLFSNNYLIGKILVKQGQAASAASYLLKSLELNDSIKKEEENHNIKEAALTYEIGKKEAINESLKKEAELNKTIIDKTQAMVKLQKFYIAIIALFLAFSLLFLFIVFRNSRIRKRLNKELSNSNQEVHDKNEKLHELININSKIFSIISHDLKSPMISLHNSIALLRDAELDTTLKEKIFNTTEIQVNTTIELLENLIKWAKTHDSGIQVKLEKVHIYAVVQQNLNLIKAATLNKELQVVSNCGEGVEALGDVDLINLILRNLLSNAIKFTPRKGEIKVATVLIDQNVVISVSDSGSGITEEDKTKIFCTDEFVSHRGTENEPGSGLGLKLCLNYIKYMNGEFEIKSVLGEGSTFIVKFPAYSDSKNQVKT